MLQKFVIFQRGQFYAIYGHASFRSEPQALDGKCVFFIYIIKCQSMNYNSEKFQVNRLRNKKVTIYRSVLSYKQEGASLRHFDFMLVDGSDEIGYFPWKFQSHALLT